MRKSMPVLIAVLCLMSVMALAACSVLDLIPQTGGSSVNSGAGSGPVAPTPEVSTSQPGVPGSVPTEGATAAPGPGTASAPGQGITVTLADQGQIIHLKVGQRFLLDLGEGYDWTPVIADQQVVRRVPNIAVIRGAQGIYQALAVGQTTLTVTGDPTCRQSQPPCEMPIRMFNVTLVVEP